MKRMAPLASVAAAAALGVAATGSAAASTTASASSSRISSTMTAKQVKPTPLGNVASARGVLAGKATLAAPRSQIAWKLTYSGMTGRVVAALVRFTNPKGVTTAISLCVKPCTSGQTSFTFFRSKAEGEYFVNQVKAGKVDAVLQTKKNPAGEIRGVLKSTEG